MSAAADPAEEKDAKVAGLNSGSAPKENAATALVAEKKSSMKASAGDQK